jgi:hypothetical protein
VRFPRVPLSLLDGHVGRSNVGVGPSPISDGIIVGSAIKLIEAHTIKKGNDLKSAPDLVKKVGEFIGGIEKSYRNGILTKFISIVS